MDNIKPSPKALALISAGLLLFSFLSALLVSTVAPSLLAGWFAAASFLSGAAALVGFGGSIIWWIEQRDEP